MSESKQFLSLEGKPAFQRLFFFLILILGLFLLIQFVDPIATWFENAVTAVGFQYALEYGEGPLLDQAVRLSHFERIYQTDIQDPPYTISSYPPIYPLVLTPFVWIFGPHLWYARLISVISTLAAGIFIMLIIRKLTKSWVAAVFAGLTFIIMPSIAARGFQANVDALALALAFAGLYLLIRNPENRTSWIGAAFLMTAAIYTRHTFALTIPAAAFVFLLKDTPRKNAFEFAGWIALIGLSVLLTLNVISNGGFFFHVFTADAGLFEWKNLLPYLNEIQNSMILFPILGILYLIGGLWKGIRQDAWWLVAPFLVLGTLTALAAGKINTGSEALYELYAGFALLTGALLGLSGNHSKYAWVTLLMMGLLFQPITGAIHLNLEQYAPQSEERFSQVRQWHALADMIATTEGSVLGDETMSMIVTAGKELQFQPFEFKLLVQAGLWDQEVFIRSIAGQEYALILLYDPPHGHSFDWQWTPEQLAAIEQYYEMDSRLADTLVYHPIP